MKAIIKNQILKVVQICVYQATKKETPARILDIGKVK